MTSEGDKRQEAGGSGRLKGGGRAPWTGFAFLPSSPFYKIMVPTVDTVRYNYLVSALVANQNPTLLVGPVGTGKTSIAQSVLQSLPSSQWSVLTVNMSAQVRRGAQALPAFRALPRDPSARRHSSRTPSFSRETQAFTPCPFHQTTSNNVQSIIESRVEKRTKGVYVPLGGKSMVTFMDDLNMPAKDVFGSQPPLELIRLWLDYGFWYDRSKQTIKYIRVSIRETGRLLRSYIPLHTGGAGRLRPQTPGSSVISPCCELSSVTLPCALWPKGPVLHLHAFPTLT